MKKTMGVLIFFSLILFTADVYAQMGFNPEYLGNASAPSETGFALKSFQSYYYQNRIKASDVETTFEAQFYTKGFMNDITKDEFQWALHLPIGYRRYKTDDNLTHSVTGIGNLALIVEYYHSLIYEDDTKFWFDNGIVGGMPTSTNNRGSRIGNNSYSINWFQENFFQHKKFMMTIMPIAVNWTFKDDKTNVTPGLGLTIMNGSVGYELFKNAFLGVDFGLLLGNLVGSNDGTGGNLKKSVRAYTGPAGLIAITPKTSLQFCVVVDVYTKETDRGEGIFAVLWHHF